MRRHIFNNGILTLGGYKREDFEEGGFMNPWVRGEDGMWSVPTPFIRGNCLVGRETKNLVIGGARWMPAIQKIIGKRNIYQVEIDLS